MVSLVGAAVYAFFLAVMILVPLACVELAWVYRQSNLERCFDEMDAGGRLFSVCVEDSMPQPLATMWEWST